ncbi:hypothetical protein BBP40_007727 [Aspergillus hancockii]|nr:hypothetical protein BBP40_007727 [Aspergillus hancockii]
MTSLFYLKALFVISILPSPSLCMQPDALSATNDPRGPLTWGEVNVLHTTGIHGWLEGHIKERNYGADRGDFISFVKHMNDTAKKNKRDLLVVDTGDLHEGNRLSDITEPKRKVSDPIFKEMKYDLLTVGNQELYNSTVALDIYNGLSKTYRDRYLASNVNITIDGSNVPFGAR